MSSHRFGTAPFTMESGGADHEHEHDHEEEEEEEDVGFDVDLLATPLDSDLLCSICRRIVEGPQELTCGHMFCGAHISRWLAAHAACPLCRQPARAKETLHFLYHNKLDLVRLRCCNASCPATALRLADVRPHLAACPFAVVPCRWPGCPRGDLLRGEAGVHEDMCEHRSVSCPRGCGELVPALLLPRHDPRCANRPQPCPGGCGDLVSPSALAQHRAVECRQEHVVCPILGCHARFPRASIEEHMQFEWREHQALLLTTLSSMRGEMLALQRQAEHAHRNMLQLQWRNASLNLISPLEGVDMMIAAGSLFSLLTSGRVLVCPLLEDEGDGGNRSGSGSGGSGGGGGGGGGRMSGMEGVALEREHGSEGASSAHTPPQSRPGGLLEGRFQGVKSLAVSAALVVAGFNSGLVRVWANAGSATLSPPYLSCAQVHDCAVQRVFLGPTRELWVVTATHLKLFTLSEDGSDLDQVFSVGLEGALLDACVAGPTLVGCDFAGTLSVYTPPPPAPSDVSLPGSAMVVGGSGEGDRGGGGGGKAGGAGSSEMPAPALSTLSLAAPSVHTQAGLGVYCVCSVRDIVFGGSRGGEVLCWRLAPSEAAAAPNTATTTTTATTSSYFPASYAAQLVSRMQSVVDTVIVSIAANEQLVATSFSSSHLILYSYSHDFTLQSLAWLVSPDERPGDLLFTDAGALLQQGHRLYVWRPQRPERDETKPVVVARSLKKT